jgi:hypothetical protein
MSQSQKLSMGELFVQITGESEVTESQSDEWSTRVVDEDGEAVGEAVRAVRDDGLDDAIGPQDEN